MGLREYEIVAKEHWQDKLLMIENMISKVTLSYYEKT